ncbi:transmembrane protein, putative (macronuclear) [Tetrahymena thermophila SB210]|uniref:Transmembrane protein, putative n=1 Tax=Tetrahymena thermophila (strain SB210) TaxID=312017 RepID=Q22BI5_TETTS|nr:transmembrane protein, putative [Tetrahymena thermophila SB210]EAR82681.2 transmembrane protein, putative [Tetrahymena thermophila SB210]|eukprot:XP_001030344.2 transmembrane protein, putative [Tetrahymena thermophila SB210]
MRIISFLTGVNIILLCFNLMIIINYFIDLTAICSGGCFIDHFFKNQLRVLFFLFIVDCFLLLLYFKASLHIKKLNQAATEYTLITQSRFIYRTLKTITMLVLVQIILLIITNIQQKNEADELQSIDCSNNTDADQCSFVSANHSVITTGKILMIVFIVLHAILFICGYRMLYIPSQRVQQNSEDRSSELNNNQVNNNQINNNQINNIQINSIQINNIQQQKHVNAIVALPTQDQERNLIQGQNLDQMPPNGIFSYKPSQNQNQQKQQNQLQIGEAVLL